MGVSDLLSVVLAVCIVALILFEVKTRMSKEASSEIESEAKAVPSSKADSPGVHSAADGFQAISTYLGGRGLSLEQQRSTSLSDVQKLLADEILPFHCRSNPEEE